MTTVTLHYDAAGAILRVADDSMPIGYFGPLPETAVGSITVDRTRNAATLAAVASEIDQYIVANGVLTRDGQPVPLWFSDWAEDTLAVLATAVADILGSSSGDMTDTEIAAALNAQNQRGLVPLWELSIYLIESGLWLVLQGSTSLGARSALAYLTLPHVTTIDMDRPSVAGMFTMLVNDEVLTQAQVDAIRAMANNRVSRREQLGLPIITAAAVADARASA